MNYQEALKKVTATKSKEGFMAINLSYDKTLVLPYKDGVQLLNTLNSVEQLHEPYNDQHRIAPFERDALTIKLMSNDEYVRIKVAALLGVKPDEVKTIAAALEPKETAS